MDVNFVRYKVINLIKSLLINPDINNKALEYMDIIDVAGMDSITFISLIVALEEQFEITIPDNMLLMEKFRTIDSIVEIIMTEMNNQHQLGDKK